MNEYLITYNYAGITGTVTLVARSMFHALAKMIVLWRDATITSIKEIA
jgi:hypothetical protein